MPKLNSINPLTGGASQLNYQSASLQYPDPRKPRFYRAPIQRLVDVHKVKQAPIKEEQNSATTTSKINSFIRFNAPYPLQAGWSAGKSCVNAASWGIQSIWGITPEPIKKPLKVLGTVANTTLYICGASLLYQGWKSLPEAKGITTVVNTIADYTIKPVVNAATPLVVDALSSAKNVVQQAVIDTATDAALSGAPLAVNGALTFSSEAVRLGTSLVWSAVKDTWEVATALDYTTQAYLVSAVGSVVFAKYYALPKIRRLYQGPPLPRWIYRDDARRVTPLSRAVQNLKQKLGCKNKEPAPILNEGVRNRVETIVEANKNILNNRGWFKNVLLLGDPGTGKTMLAQTIAQESNFNYIQISGAEFARYIQIGGALECFNQLLHFIRESIYPTVLLIDEIDALCPNPDRCKNSVPSREEKQFRSAFLSAIGKSSKLLLVGTTNYEEDIDRALLSRLNNRIHMELPDCDSRAKILTQYIDRYLGKNIPERTTCLNANGIQKLAEKTEGMSGRTLFQFVDGLAMHRPSTVDGVLTEETVQEVLGFYLDDLKREQKSKEAQRQKKEQEWAAHFGGTSISAPSKAKESPQVNETIEALSKRIAVLENALTRPPAAREKSKIRLKPKQTGAKLIGVEKPRAPMAQVTAQVTI